MNLLTHVLLSYKIASYFTADPVLMAAAVLLGVLPDLDHLSHIPKALKTLRFGSASRSRFHELYGLSVITILLAMLPAGIMPALFFPPLSHYLLDFFTRETRPFYPRDRTELYVGWYPKGLKMRTLSDIILTGGLLLWAL